MEHDFWQRRWEKNEIAFHEGAPNALFIKYMARLALEEGARIFLPLCGKTRDIHWLLSQGFRIAGAELSVLAVDQLFAELGVVPTKTQAGASVRYSAKNIEIFQGDIFELDAETLGYIDAVYDRAALVALPETLRARYTAHIVALTNTARQMLISFDYDQSAMEGPPFSVSGDEIHAHYDSAYEISLLESAEVVGGLKGKCPAAENIWLLEPR